MAESKHPVREEGFKKQRSVRKRRREYVTKEGEVKVFVTLLLSKEVYEAFKAKAAELYGPGKGAFSRCIEDMLRSWLMKNNPGKVSAKTEYTWRRVLEIIAELQGASISELVNGEVLEKHLEHAISRLRGSDPRTIKKWILLFEKHGFIEYKAGFRPNRVFKIRLVPLMER
ncbi:MAG: hypothetical protein QXM43_01605 [Desulfurococcaceae archaeon]